MNERSAVVLFSGGLDSTVMLALLVKQWGYDKILALTFDYGQSNQSEVLAATRIARKFDCVEHEVVSIGPRVLRSSSSLLKNGSAEALKGTNSNYIAHRNLFFLSVAANRCVDQRCDKIFIGSLSTSAAGFPDNSLTFFSKVEGALFDGCPWYISIQCPLIEYEKEGVVRLARDLGILPLLEDAVTDYTGSFPPDPNDHASKERARAFHKAGIGDPMIIKAKRLGLLPEDWPDTGYVENR